MNKLTKTDVIGIFGSVEAARAFDRRWRELTNSPAKTSLRLEHHLLAQAIRGRDWRRGLTAPTNFCKVANGAQVGLQWRLYYALNAIALGADALRAPFGDAISGHCLSRLAARLPDTSRCRPDQLAPGRWPFDAYVTSESSQ